MSLWVQSLPLGEKDKRNVNFGVASDRNQEQRRLRLKGWKRQENVISLH